MNEFIEELNNGFSSSPEDSVLKDIWQEYERVIIKSLITAFGFDFLIKDRKGGDVDTIHNVRDPEVEYKNTDNALAYAQKTAYDTVEYHKDYRYVDTILRVKGSHKFFQDSYDPNKQIYYGKANILKENQQQANLDHVIATKEIHEDPGRILAGLKGTDLANSDENLRFTNDRLNKSKGADSVEDFIARREKSGNPLDEDIKRQMRQQDKIARNSYNDKLNKAYYNSEQFAVDMATAATKLGLKMGLRQALGFVFVEIWMACKKELLTMPAGSNVKEFFKAIKAGINLGLESVEKNYKDLLFAFGEGVFAGIVSSIITTLLNTFVTTEGNVVRNLRQIIMCITQAGNVLIFNPNNLPSGERIKMATLTIASGVNSVVGMTIGDYIEKSLVGTIPDIGKTVSRFCSVLVSGLLSCTFLLFLDRSNFVNHLVDELNEYQTADYTIYETSKRFTEIVARMENYNIDEFRYKCDELDNSISLIVYTNDEYVLSKSLQNITEKLGFEMPWTGNFDEFMSDLSNKLCFE